MFTDSSSERLRFYYSSFCNLWTKKFLLYLYLVCISMYMSMSVLPSLNNAFALLLLSGLVTIWIMIWTILAANIHRNLILLFNFYIIFVVSKDYNCTLEITIQGTIRLNWICTKCAPRYTVYSGMGFYLGINGSWFLGIRYPYSF